MSSGRRRDARAAALEAASEIFVERGYEDTSMDAVSAWAGVSKATLYAHYGDKAGLFKAFMDRARELHVALDHFCTPRGDARGRADLARHVGRVGDDLRRARRLPTHLGQRGDQGHPAL